MILVKGQRLSILENNYLMGCQTEFVNLGEQVVEGEFVHLPFVWCIFVLVIFFPSSNPQSHVVLSFLLFFDLFLCLHFFFKISRWRWRQRKWLSLFWWVMSLWRLRGGQGGGWEVFHILGFWFICLDSLYKRVMCWDSQFVVMCWDNQLDNKWLFVEKHINGYELRQTIKFKLDTITFFSWQVCRQPT
jgi:hypothetical protein